MFLLTLLLLSKKVRQTDTRLMASFPGNLGCVFLLSRWPAAEWLSVSVLCFCPASDLIYSSRWAAYSAPFVADWVAEKKDGGGQYDFFRLSIFVVVKEACTF